MTQTTCYQPRHHLLQRLGRLPRQRRQRAAVDNCCEVCLLGQRDGVGPVPCGHARFCTSCVDRIVGILSCNFMSCIFMSCIFRLCTFMRYTFVPSFSCPAISCLANSSKIGPSVSCPAFSCPAHWSVNFMSCNFMSCKFDGPSFSCPAFSVNPLPITVDHV